MDPKNPDIIVDADELVPPINSADIPLVPPEGISDPADIDAAAIDAAANHVFRSTLAAMGQASNGVDADADVRQRLQDIIVGLVRRLEPELKGSPQWTEQKDYHQKVLDAALRFREGLIENVLGSVLLQEHLRRLRGPGLSLN